MTNKLSTDVQAANVAAVAKRVIAPALTAYVAWVLHDARRRRLDRLYFVSRDGQILHLIASLLRRDGDPECRYLYGSRQAWLLPSVRCINEESISWAWMKGMSRTGYDILQRLESDDELALSILAHEGFDVDCLNQPLAEHHIQRLVALIRNDPLASILLEKAQKRRTLLMEYLAQEGCVDGATWALVDIGWRLNCQRALNRVLNATSVSMGINGYYFGISHDHAPLDKVGAVFPFIAHSQARVGSVCKADWLFKRSTVAVVENLFVVSDQESVRGYRKMESLIEPVFKSEGPATGSKSLAAVVHQTIRAYLDDLTRVRAANPLSDNYRQRSLATMKRFCLYPNPFDVLGIADLQINDEPTHGTAHWSRLAFPIDMRLFLKIAVDYFSGRSEHGNQLKFSWVAGSAAISSWPVRLIFIVGSFMSSALESFRLFRIHSLKGEKGR